MGAWGAAGKVAVLAVVLVGCSHVSDPAAPTLPRPVSGSPDQPPVAAIVPGSVRLAERGRCIDRELRRRGLNAYGDPEGTTYPNGSPLLNELTGTMANRYDYVVRWHRDIGTICGVEPESVP